MGQFLLNIFSTLCFIIIILIIQPANSKQISSEIYKSGARLKYDVGDNLDIHEGMRADADTREYDYTKQDPPEEYEDAYEYDDDYYDGDGGGGDNSFDLEDDDYEDYCNENEIFYYKSQQCVPAKCRAGEERDHQSGFCHVKVTGQVFDPTMLYSGSIYSFGRKTSTPRRTKLGKYRRWKSLIGNGYRTQRPKVYAKWFADLHPEVKGQRPVAGV